MGDDAIRTAVVTGANAGIGLETARGLAAAGLRTVLLCRNAERAEAARADIAATAPGAELDVVLADIGSQEQVRRAVAELEARYDALHVLVNNAGVILKPKQQQRTADGHDAYLATNHLGPFLLTNLLLPLLERGAPSRIVTLTSVSQKHARLHLDDLQCERRGYGPFGMVRYAETKLMNVLFTRELAARLRGTGVTATCVHPGNVGTTILPLPPRLATFGARFVSTPAEGAATSLVAALDPAHEGRTGTYFAKGRPADGDLGKLARRDDLARELWDRSARLVGLPPQG
jgi:retinol dehydrogenase-12